MEAGGWNICSLGSLLCPRYLELCKAHGGRSTSTCQDGAKATSTGQEPASPYQRTAEQKEATAAPRTDVAQGLKSSIKEGDSHYRLNIAYSFNKHAGQLKTEDDPTKE